ncbi:DHH family phosphoesterase [Treponema sp. OMZ 787]|uniref:DHH family phosphoesterase n=1 Tax=Treponema sp. OMZ 787 TaxID=2563669 RepID=UPI0020A593E2|nr:DHH family phosphoesterase [Treponema sp. OMZ 787]UTC61856.1 DHH family phosphoesterase [Treponema sp. OMZ 787]
MSCNNCEIKKIKPISIGRKNAVMERIFDLIYTKSSFLLLGHKHADEDCISSVVAFGLFLRKFGKTVNIFLEDFVPDNLSFFAEICRYNSISLFVKDVTEKISPDVVVILDTPKPDMIASNDDIEVFLKDKKLPKVEIDHHFAADADYSGDVDYRLTLRASSTCEIIGQICLKLEKRPEILKKYGINELYSRNIVLAMLTGMIGDAKMGNYLFKRRDKAFYNYFLKKFNSILHEQFNEGSKNISSVNEIVDVMEKLSDEDARLYESIMKNTSYDGRVGVIILDEKQSNALSSGIDYNQFLGVIKRATDNIAEKVGGVGISAYFDPAEISDKIQLRIRASGDVKGIDLRPILSEFSITDGGGHPGAIGFRFPRTEIKDLPGYVDKISKRVKILIPQS